MSLFTQMIQLQMQILLMLGIGFFLRKKEIVTAEIRKGLSINQCSFAMYSDSVFYE